MRGTYERKARRKLPSLLNIQVCPAWHTLAAWSRTWQSGWRHAGWFSGQGHWNEATLGSNLGSVPRQPPQQRCFLASASVGTVILSPSWATGSGGQWRMPHARPSHHSAGVITVTAIAGATTLTTTSLLEPRDDTFWEDKFHTQHSGYND